MNAARPAWPEPAAPIVPEWVEHRGHLPTAAEEYREMTRLLPLIDPGTWQDVEPTERQWAWAGNIPHRQATYLTGPGSAGKSLLGQQLATCHALARPFLGVDTRGGPAIYITCEDDADELHRRQHAICRALHSRLSDLSGKLHLVSLAGELGNELFSLGDGGALEPTARFRAIKEGAEAIGAKLIVLDNVAHLFGGNENVRHEVAAFVSLLNKLAMSIDGSVLLIGHPNKAGDSFSGSTAWENQVRSRLFMECPADTLDRDARVLSRQKANYAQNGEAIEFRWHEWAFILDDDLPDDKRAEIAAVVQANGENDAFLRCLAAATERQRAVSHNPGSNYAPKVFAAMPEARGVSAKSFAVAMERLLHLGTIALDQPLWRGPNRVMKQGIKLAEKCTDPPARTPCTDPHETPRNPARFNPPYTTYNSGAANGAAAPDPIPANGMILAPGETGDDAPIFNP